MRVNSILSSQLTQVFLGRVEGTDLWVGTVGET